MSRAARRHAVAGEPTIAKWVKVLAFTSGVVRGCAPNCVNVLCLEHCAGAPSRLPRPGGGGYQHDVGSVLQKSSENLTRHKAVTLNPKDRSQRYNSGYVWGRIARRPPHREHRADRRLCVLCTYGWGLSRRQCRYFLRAYTRRYPAAGIWPVVQGVPPRPAGKFWPAGAGP